jgi:NAD(P)-dependent dehydrogenase (short-subunit alcohol dehydrogenase family)
MKANSTIEVTFVEIDLADNSSVRKAAAKIKATTNKIDKLINNAGIMGVETFSTSKDGIETQFATNHVGHFLLTNLLMGELVAAAKGATIVNLSSKGHELAEVNLEDPNFEVSLILL